MCLRKKEKESECALNNACDFLLVKECSKDQVCLY